MSASASTGATLAAAPGGANRRSRRRSFGSASEAEVAVFREVTGRRVVCVLCREGVEGKVGVSMTCTPARLGCLLYSLQVWSHICQRGLRVHEGCAIGEDPESMVLRFLRANQCNATKTLQMLEDDLVREARGMVVVGGGGDSSAATDMVGGGGT